MAGRPGRRVRTTVLWQPVGGADPLGAHLVSRLRCLARAACWADRTCRPCGCGGPTLTMRSRIDSATTGLGNSEYQSEADGWP